MTKQKSNPFLAIKAIHDAEAQEEQGTTSAQVHKATGALKEVTRNPRGIRIRDDLFRKYRILAIEEGIPLYALVETALEEHLAGKEGARKEK